MSTVHVVVVPLGSWGHLKPLVALCINLALIHPELRFTIITVPYLASRVESQLDDPGYRSSSSLGPPAGSKEREANDGPKDLGQRFRVVALTGSVLGDGEFRVADMDAQIEEYGRLLGSQLVHLLGDSTGPEEEWGRPRLCIYDAFQVGFIPALQSACTSQNVPMESLKKLCFMPSNVSWAYNCWCSADQGSDLARDIQVTDRLIREEGMNEAEAMTRAFGIFIGEVVRIPGMKPFYDYEQYPQYHSLPVIPALMMVRRPLYAQKTHCDGFVFPWSPELEPEVLVDYEEVVGKPCFAMGPQHKTSSWRQDLLTAPERGSADAELVEWLDAMQAEQGERSVLYFCLGSLTWPMLRPDLIVALVTVLIEQRRPFLLAKSSPFAQIPHEELETAIQKAGPRGKSLKWVNQERVLRHPATGAFLSHMGSNSVGEAILAGIPMIGMPFMGDQPEFAQQMEILGVAIELRQIRTNGVSKRTHDGILVENTPDAIRKEFGEVLDLVFGKEGHRMRSKMEDLRRLMEQSWRSGGSRQAMEGFKKLWSP